MTGQALPAPAHAGGEEHPVAPSPPLYRLPEPIRKKFEAGRSFGGVFAFTLGASESDEYNAACWLAALGFTPEGLVALVEERDKRGGRERPPGPGWSDHAAEWLAIGRWMVHGIQTNSKRPWFRYRAAVKDLDPSGMPRLNPEALDSYLSSLRSAHAATLTGRSASTDMAVVVVLCDTAAKAGRINPGISIRRLMKLANIASMGTVHKSLKRLQESGFAQCFSGDTAEASKYLLREPAETGTVLIEITALPLPVGVDNYCSGFDRVAPLSHPAFHRWALGPRRRRLLKALASGSPIKKNVEWYSAAGLTERQFYDLRHRLDGTDGTPATVRKDDTGWHLVEDLARVLDLVAEHYNTAEKHQRRDTAHALQREGYRQMLISRLPDRYKLHDQQNVVDTTTGELVPLGKLVTPFGGVLAAAGAGPTSAGPHCCPLLNDPRVRVRTHLQVSIRPPIKRNCEACGQPSDQVEPVSGLPWHLSCRMPHWNARRHRALGLTIPDHLVKYPTQAADFDPYDLDSTQDHRTALRVA